MSKSDVLASIADPAYQTELGAYNIEFNVPPAAAAGHARHWSWKPRCAPA